MGLGTKIKSFGKSKFGSLTSFAKALDMSQPNLSAYINETRGPGSPFLKKLYSLGCDMNWLFSEDEDNEEVPSLLSEIEMLRVENRELKDKITHAKLILD